MFKNFILNSLIASLMVQSSFAYSKKRNTENNKKMEKVLNIGNVEDPSSLDPQKCNESTCNSIVRQLFEGLVRSDKNGTIIPASAESWEISADNKVYTFHLRKNLKWSDGSDITAHDFVYSFQRLVDPKTASEQSILLENIANGKEIIEGSKLPTSLGVKAINDYTFEITLIRHNPIFLENLVITNTFPVRRKNVEKYNNSFTQVGSLVSNGAYKLTYRIHSDKVTIERNPYYWNDKKTYIEKVNFISINDKNNEIAMYETGQLDITSDIPINQYKKLIEKYPLDLVNYPSISSYYYIYNTQKPPLNNKKLRQALDIAIDRDVIVYSLLNMDQVPLYDPVPYGIKNYTQNKAIWQDWPREKQIEEAKKLYKEAGFSKEKPLTINISYNTSDMHKKIAIAIASMWKDNLAVNVEFHNEEWKTMFAKRLTNDFEVMRYGDYADVNDATDFLNRHRSFDPVNASKYKNPEFDLILNQASVEIDLEKRKKLLEKAGRIIMEDAPVSNIMTYSYFNVLKKPYVKGFYMDKMERYYLSGVYIENH